jgi:hypothetical protein
VGSKTFDGVRFSAWSDDHDPIHVHGFYAGVELAVDLYISERRVEASRNPEPRNAKRSDVAHILSTAERHFDALAHLAEDTWKRRNQ